MEACAPLLRNGSAVELASIPRLEVAGFRASVIEEIGAGRRLAALFGVPHSRLYSSGESEEMAGPVRLFALLANDAQGTIRPLTTDVQDSYDSLTPECPQAHWFERELSEQWNLTPVGHPWLKPIRFHPPYRGDRPIIPPIGAMEFFKVEGPEIHEVAVGPVHAGIIEPGHFRFQCHGVNVLHLEISLGYQHRGVERALVGGPDKRTLHIMETLSGDTTIGHTFAYAQILEALAGIEVPHRANAIRGIALELERLANHTGDLGALAGDVGFLPTASFCGRIRGDFLNLTALVCGNRFGRGWIIPGGVHFDIEESRARLMLERLRTAATDVRQAADLLWDTPSVMARFERTGFLSRQTCLDLGIVGPASRASGIERDARLNHPTGVYRQDAPEIAVQMSGDVLARAKIRRMEIDSSTGFVEEQVQDLAKKGRWIDPDPGDPSSLRPGLLAVSLVEGWRGELCHVAITGESGRFAAYKIVDPSFHNWFGLAMAMRGQPISDFPLCNKSFNLSYCGHDL